MTTRLLLARHGETDWNVQGRWQGQTDIPLNAVGQRQAAKLAVRLADVSFDAAYSSDLKRAYETAEQIAAGRAFDVHPEPRLREIGLGVAEGLTSVEIRSQYTEAFVRWQADRDRPMLGGEALSAVAARVQSFLDDVTAAHPEGRVLVVSHGAALRVLLCLALGIPPAKFIHFYLGNTALSELRINAHETVLLYLNDTGHVQGDHTGS